MTDKHLTQIRFDGFDLDPRILAGLADAGFSRCTPIQAETLPIALAGRDVAGQAQTGTGKTAAFLLVVMQRLLNTPPPPPGPISHPRALILAPTRELAVQIHRDTLLLATHTGLRSGLVYGGTGYQQQRDDLAAGVDILIGTPGRLIDYLKQNVFDLKAIEAVVLDEADRMFDLGFIKDIRFLLRRMPPPESRLGMLFSATLSYRVTELAYEHMNRPLLIKIETDKITADRVRQCCYMTSNEEKIPLLIGLVRGWDDARIMVFVNTKREADRVWGYLQGNGINTAVLSGDVPQNKRLKLLRDFTEGNLPVLVGTDVAARGLHIPDVTHVVNYDLPEDPEDYVHRIGRTARAGAAGDAIGFVCETYAFCLPDIETFIGARIPVFPVDPALLAEVDPRSRLRPAREDREERRDGRGATPARGERAKREGPGARAERSRASTPRRTSETRPVASAKPAEAASTAPVAAPVSTPATIPASTTAPDLQPIPPAPAPPARVRRPATSRPKVERAALTSRPLSPAKPKPEPAPATLTAPLVESTLEPVTSLDETKPKRRRRRRKPTENGADTTQANSNPLPETVE
ncbi:DEAD/DEAH box helicase [uncultured Thiocystis sp.]|jgi:ATP-dependent RNA helicase RhlB|uniref:DEAD/DEAH box helicase n=1 Tax=uncultured Thiocystis sp. TaxID=1202134 RepID=UPI0025F1A0E5|nr:DEAD/DEAH box helicase [uncultured Thiocystis sp.]